MSDDSERIWAGLIKVTDLDLGTEYQRPVVTEVRRGRPPGICAGLGERPVEGTHVRGPVPPRYTNGTDRGQCPECERDVPLDYRGLVTPHNKEQ